MFFFAVFLAGYGYFIWRADSKPVLPSGKVAFVAHVVSEPVQNSNMQSFTAAFDAPVRADMAIRTSALIDFAYGDRIEGNGSFSEDKAGNPEMVRPSVRVAAHGEGNWIKAQLFRTKDAFTGVLERNLSPNAAALLGGMLIGQGEHFPKELKNEMVASGTAHLIALSGFNITILVLALYGTLGPRAGKKFAFICTTLAIAAFVVMTGAAPTILRAAVMGFLGMLAVQTGRPYTRKYAISFAAAFMALIDPTVLRFNLGFQLSFLCLLGVLYISPLIMERLGITEPGVLNWKQNAIATASAQLLVLPVIMSSFGSFSLSGFLANIAILEFVPITMLCGFVLGVAGLIFGSAGWLVGIFVQLIMEYHLRMIAFFASFQIVAASWLWVAALYAAFGFLLLRKPKVRHG